MVGGVTRPSGTLKVIHHRAPGPGLAWRLKNSLRPSFIFGFLAFWAAKIFSRVTGIPTIVGELKLILRRADGTVINFGTVCYRVVTSAGVAFLVDDWDNGATDITNMNYHASGTGAVAENASDTALGTEVETRTAGTKSQPAANQLKTSGTIAYTGTLAITEHGLFSASSTGTLWDRSVFSAVNVISGDNITFEYTGTVNSGG